MKYRRDKYHKNIKNRTILKVIFSLFLVLAISIFISNNLAKIIYRNTLYVRNNEDFLEDEMTTKVSNVDEKAINTENITGSSIVMFQGGVFTDLDNAEEFKNKVGHKTLASIVNDGKYEKVLLGVSDSENFSDMVGIFKNKNLQFVKQIYRIPTEVPYSSEIVKIIEKFSEFIIDNYNDLFEGEFSISDFKKKIYNISADYGKTGLYREFNDLKELILEFDDNVFVNELESILDFLYHNLEQYKV